MHKGFNWNYISNAKVIHVIHEFSNLLFYKKSETIVKHLQDKQRDQITVIYLRSWTERLVVSASSKFSQFINFK